MINVGKYTSPMDGMGRYFMVFSYLHDDVRFSQVAPPSRSREAFAPRARSARGGDGTLTSLKLTYRWWKSCTNDPHNL